jgi:multidrug transporter EmrE-like cation transporter
MFFFRQFDLTSLEFGSAMALIDVFVLGSLKAFSIGLLKWPGVIVLSMLVYSIQPLIFLQSLKTGSLSIMNLLWNVASDVLVTLTGIYYFSEKITNIKQIGILFSIISIFLLSWKDGDE